MWRLVCPLEGTCLRRLCKGLFTNLFKGNNINLNACIKWNSCTPPGYILDIVDIVTFWQPATITCSLEAGSVVLLRGQGATSRDCLRAHAAVRSCVYVGCRDRPMSPTAMRSDDYAAVGLLPSAQGGWAWICCRCSYPSRCCVLNCNLHDKSCCWPCVWICRW